MSPSGGGPKSKRGAGPPAEVTRLTALGLTAGTPVRFRRITKTRWYTGRLERLERDGSIGIGDSQGALRSIPVADVVIPATGPRGGQNWQPLIDFLLVGEQIELFDDGTAPASTSGHAHSHGHGQQRAAVEKPARNPDQFELAEVDDPDPLPMAPPPPPPEPEPEPRDGSVGAPEVVDLDGEPLDPGHCLGQQAFEF